MSIFTKIVTGIFGKKSEKDLKILEPYVEKINNFLQSLSPLTNEELIGRFQAIRDELKELVDFANIPIEDRLRFMNSNYPNWKKMFEQEFNDFVEPNVLLTGKETEILNWILENKTDQNFKVKDVAEGLRMDGDNMRKYLKRLVDLDILATGQIGGINFYQLTSTN